MPDTCDTTSQNCSEGERQHDVDKTGKDCCDIPEKLLCLADEAWKDALKAKIREKIEKNQAEKLEQLATLVADANHRRWKHMIEAKQGCESFKHQVKEILTGE